MFVGAASGGGCRAAGSVLGDEDVGEAGEGFVGGFDGEAFEGDDEAAGLEGLLVGGVDAAVGHGEVFEVGGGELLPRPVGADGSIAA